MKDGEAHLQPRHLPARRPLLIHINDFTLDT